jgi:pantetheine-phosphate adenylyltransferase
MKRIAFFPGSFDPFTKGHEDIVRRGLALFDEVIIGIGSNVNKKRYFEADLIKACIEETFKEDQNISVVIFDALTADIAIKNGATFLLRGLRNTTDFEYENTIAQVNKHLQENLESVFLITSPKYAPISSTVVRDLHRYGADVSRYVPYKLP